MADAARQWSDERRSGLPELDDRLTVVGSAGLEVTDQPRVKDATAPDGPSGSDEPTLDTLTWLGSYEVLIV